MSTATKPAPDEVVRKKSSTTTAGGLAIKLILVGLIDALLVWALIQCISDGWTLGVGFFIFALIAVNLVYFTRGLPMKYLLPGLMFLLVYQLFTMMLTGYSSFTNYGTGHLGDKDDAISALLAARSSRSPTQLPTRSCPSRRAARSRCWSPSRRAPPRPARRSSAPPRASRPCPPDQLQTSGEKVTGVTGYQSLNLGTLSTTRTSPPSGPSCASRSTTPPARS